MNIHKILVAPVLMVLLVTFCGCRRSDVREFCVEIPGLSETNKSVCAQIAQVLSVYEGVHKDSYGFDFAAHRLTLRYDSMKVARMNILQAIESKGVKVTYPEVKGGYAGYLDEKSK